LASGGQTDGGVAYGGRTDGGVAYSGRTNGQVKSLKVQLWLVLSNIPDLIPVNHNAL